jgi:hypothetical protein
MPDVESPIFQAKAGVANLDLYLDQHTRDAESARSSIPRLESDIDDRLRRLGAQMLRARRMVRSGSMDHADVKHNPHQKAPTKILSHSRFNDSHKERSNIIRSQRLRGMLNDTINAWCNLAGALDQLATLDAYWRVDDQGNRMWVGNQPLSSVIEAILQREIIRRGAAGLTIMAGSPPIIAPSTKTERRSARSRSCP